MANRISIEQSLKAYQVMHAPAKFSWKVHWANETFSNPDLLSCSESEQRQFDKRLKECDATLCTGVKVMNGRPITLDVLLNTIIDPANKSIEKTKRKVIYSTSDGLRPTSDDAYLKWNGFQVIDLDIKDEKLAKLFKQKIFNSLCNCNWFLGVTLSASGMGLHIYTKITVPQDLMLPIEKKEDIVINQDLDKAKLFYHTNFRHKLSYVYIACLKANDEIGVDKNVMFKWFDLHQAKPQQGAFIGYDAHPLFNTRFFEDFIYMDYDNSDMDWISHPDLREMFKGKEYFVIGDGSEHLQVAATAPAGEVSAHTKIHYKHDERWRLANTLVNLYGKVQGNEYLRMICANTIRDAELKSDCETAYRHKKSIDPWAVNRLNSVHGFNIKMNIEDEKFDESELFTSMGLISNPTIIRESKYVKTFNLKANEYLGHIRNELINECGRITLIEAGAGVGKTEMVKTLVKSGKRVLMVMPFTSTIKAKVENDPDWYYCYGNRKVKLDMPNNGLCMTIDKFSRIADTTAGLADVKASGFDYIFIDESHLLFQSKYRTVMPKVVDMIKNTDVAVILMSGTPSGELVFFQDAIHIRVIKEETRKKVFKVNLTETPKDSFYQLCKDMANDIANGRRILFPCNRGNLYARQVKAGVSFFLKNDHAIFDEVNLQYYKKSNVGDKFMDDVNLKKTVKDVQILMCTTYLSVGVDILDRYKFSVYFVDLMMPQEVEQFANRLRSNDLFIHIYVSKNDGDGNTMSLHKYKPIDFTIDDDEKGVIAAIIQLCNSTIIRNKQEYKSNAIMYGILRENQFIKRNSSTDLYDLDYTAYAIETFEDKYRKYVQQLPVLMKGMQAYGYEIIAEDKKSISFEGIEDFDNLKTLVKNAYDEGIEYNTNHVEELMEQLTENNLDTCKSVLNGSFNVVKSDTWDFNKNQVTMSIKVKNVEMFEKVVPIFSSMSKRYDVSTIKEIFNACRNKNGSFNFSAIDRMRTLINLCYNDKNERLDLPIKEFMYSVYDLTEPGLLKKGEIENFCNTFAENYARQSSSEKVNILCSYLAMDSLRERFLKLFKCLCKVGRASKKTNGLVPVERIELLWKEKEYYTSTNLNEKLFVFAEFFEMPK